MPCMALAAEQKQEVQPTTTTTEGPSPSMTKEDNNVEGGSVDLTSAFQREEVASESTDLSPSFSCDCQPLSNEDETAPRYLTLAPEHMHRHRINRIGRPCTDCPVI
mmetsp:Transcript_47797/g.53492  ORF Transcript_47797/g.53492 Transcript_47797/m.53492 type:complete len:106 (+) Transcript_47797:103-420(+)